VDRLDPARRSTLMARVRSKNTKPEMTVRQALHALGFRYRLHARGLPGSPDLVFPARRKAIFVHGCFWHGHDCRYGLAQPKSNVAFWRTKLEANMARDARVKRKLRAAGWSVATVWECAVRRDAWLTRILRFLRG
jgi:DNA mismatch endonuclease (patch repair protein)